MLEVEGFNPNPLYIKKRINASALKSALNIIDDEIMSLQSTPAEKIESIAEEKNCTVLESEESQQRRQSKEFSQGTIDRIRAYGEAHNFRVIVKELMRKRGEVQVTAEGQFKPELYHRDFHYYFNSHKFMLMIKRVTAKKPQLGKSYQNFVIGLKANSCDQSIDKLSSLAGNSLNITLKTKKTGRTNISKCLTKIPSKVAKGGNPRLDMAFNKAKDAARVVRRLEYSYNMKMNMMYSKQEHKSNAMVIQKWWKRMLEIKRNSPYAKRIQKLFRGMLTRSAFRRTLVFIQYLPFISVLHAKFYSKLPQIGFDEMLFRHGIKTINTVILPSTNLLLKRIKKFLASRAGNIRKIYHMRCNMKKYVYDIHTATVIEKLQGRMKIFLMRNNDAIMLYHARNVHPYMYFLLKYGADKAKTKIVSFRRCFHRFQEFHLQVNKGIDSKFELLPFLMRKQYWKMLKEYNEEVKAKDNNRPIKKRLIRKTLIKNDKKNIRKAFLYWKRYNNVHLRFIRPHHQSLVTMMTNIIQNKKNIFSTFFLNKINRKAFLRPTKCEAMKTIIEIKYQMTPSSMTYLNKAFQDWRYNVRRLILTKSSRKLNRFLKSSNTKHKKSKAIKRLLTQQLIKTAAFYRGAKEIQLKQVLRKGICRFVYTKIRSIGFKEKMGSLLKHLLQPTKTRFIQWAFENRKYNHSILDYIQLLRHKNLCKKRKSNLIEIYSHLKHRLQKYFLRKSFLKYRMNSGIYFRRPQCANHQLLFLNKERRVMSQRKYRLLRYTVNKITTEQEDFRINSKLIGKWDEWKTVLIPFKKHKLLKRRVKKLIAFEVFLQRKSLLIWKKKCIALNGIFKFKNNQRSVKTCVKKIEESDEE